MRTDRIKSHFEEEAQEFDNLTQGNEPVTNCYQLKMLAPDGKKYRID